MAGEQNADTDVISEWLARTEKKHPHLLQGSRVTKFREVVISCRSFRDILAADDQPYDANVRVVDDPNGLQRFLYKIIKMGCCVTLRHFLGVSIDVDVTDEDGATALHVAVEYDNYEDLKLLLEAGAHVKADERGLTPLHIAALSNKPNRKIAKLLIDYMKQQDAELDGYNLINAQSGESDNESIAGGNTALHFATENEEVSSDFIRALRSVNPSVKNEDDETAFHMAARSENPDVIGFMLEVFTPDEKGWEMTDIENNKGPTLLEICARRGNSKAVELLIKYGADISYVLFDIIDESVSDPTKTERLLGVYYTSENSAVRWESQKNK